MRRLLLFLIILIFPLGLSAQWYGDGLSAGTAYYGVINAANPMPVWTTARGTVFIGSSIAGQNDLEVATGGTLTIQPGVTVKLCTTSSDLRITGTGVLNATGTSLSPVVFTKDSQASWGHISFEASTGVSVINYCTIEYGRKTGAGLEGYGGGIQANTNTLTISNSTIRNNYGLYGGGLFVNAGRNPVISNCYVYNNQSLHSGGGFYFWNTSSSVVTNCIFDSNHCLEPSVAYYTGGGLAAQTNCAIKVVNCTFVNNTSTRPEGQAILLHGSPNSRVVNSIFWGSAIKQIYCYGTAGAVIINSAYRGITYTTGTAPVSPVILNSSNSAPDGPNFTNPALSDWSITFISPCRDAGVNTYPGVTIPLLDYIGNGRIGPTDIGAYEVILSRWTGTVSTDWNNAANWQGSIAPFLSMSDVIIPSGATNYPTGSPLQDYTVGTGRYMIVEAGAKATLGTLTNNGTLNLQSSATGIFSLDMNSYTGTGVANIAMYVTGGGGLNNWKWHYVAVPKNYIGDKTMFTNINSFDLMRYDDSKIPSIAGATDNAGWMWHDGYAGTTGFSDLDLNRGYSFYHANASAVVNFTNLSSLQTSIGSLPLQYSGLGKLAPTIYGFNLLGNSLTCGLNWNQVIESDPADIRDYVYYTINYKVGSYLRNAPTGINGATQHIPPLQGFLVKTGKAGTSLNFSAAKEHTNQLRYKKGLDLSESESSESGATAPMVKLELNNQGNQDETLVWFTDNSTKGPDRDVEAPKLLSSDVYDQIYTVSGSENLGINGMPLPEETVTIPVAVVLLKAGSNFKIIASQMQGLENYKVTLTDKMNSNFTMELKNGSSYSFSSDAGTFTDRFVLTINKGLAELPYNNTTEKAFNVFVFGEELNIQLLNNNWDKKVGTINIYDLTGRMIISQNNVEWTIGDIKKIPLNISQGIYIVEIKTEYQRFVSKINIIK